MCVKLCWCHDFQPNEGKFGKRAGIFHYSQYVAWLLWTDVSPQLRLKLFYLPTFTHFTMCLILHEFGEATPYRYTVTIYGRILSLFICLHERIGLIICTIYIQWTINGLIFWCPFSAAMLVLLYNKFVI